MSDDKDLEKFAAALKRAEPAPDAGRKADAMARAMAEFDRIQGSADKARQMSDRPEEGAGFWTGVAAMFSKLTTRAALAGTASIAVVGVALVAIVPNVTDPLADRTSDAVIVEQESPAVVASPQEGTAPPAPVATAESPSSSAATAAEAPRPRQTPLTLDEEVANSVTAQTAPTENDAAKAGEVATEMVGAETRGRISRAEEESDEGFVADDLAGIAEEPAMEAEAPMAGTVVQSEAVPAPSAPADRTSGLTAASPSPAPMERIIAPPEPNTEAFPEAERNGLKVTADEPVSTFSIDVDTASYGVVRSSINAGYLPDPASVRIEEMINYFPYDWPAPAADEAPFRTTVSVMETPWNADTQLVTIALKGRVPAIEDRPPLNLVFLIDTSGSMQDQNKLPLLKQSFRLMLSQLRPEDQVAIVTYAGSAGMALEPTPASERDTILGALGRLEAGGSTAGQAGLQQAYGVARQMQEDGEVTRVILATDGDFNVGISDPDALKDYIEKERESDVYLSVFGFGRGNLDDATMQALAQNGNGTAAYIDTLNEAQKVLVDQLTGALFPIADDVKIQVEWNPATVAEYRLIGYETRALAREDFNNDRVDAGEIGAGHTVTAIYEITPVGSPAIRNTPLRYGEAETVAVPTNEGELGFLRLRYKEPGEDVSQLIERPIFTDTSEGGLDAQFAAAIAGFGELLADDTYLGQWGWDEVIALANATKGEDPFGYRAEAVNLMRLAQSLSR